MKKIVLTLTFLGILISINSCSLLFAPSQEEIQAFMKEQDIKIDSTSTVLKKQLDLPQEISEKIVILGNPKAKTVLINAQGGPMTSLQNFELMYTMIQSKVNKDSLLLVNVHQYQTLRTEEFESKLTSFEAAKKHDTESTKYLAETVDYFKNKGNNVIVMGISFGAFVVEDLLANYEANADKYLIVVGRLDMPDEVWTEFSKGNYVGFKYKKGVPKIVKFTADEAGMGGGDAIADKNTSILAAGLGYKRFTTLLKDKDLSKVTYFYGTVDNQVGALLPEEVDFLNLKGVKTIKIDSDHSGTIDVFTIKYLKNIIKKVSANNNNLTQATPSKTSNTDIDPSLLGTVTTKNFTKVLPFEWSGGLPIVNVNIDGVEYKFLFDTDAPTTIPESLIKQLNLKTLGEPAKLNDSGGRQLEYLLYKLPLLSIGEVEFKDFAVFTNDFKKNFPISCLGFDGILGYNYLRDLNVKLDYANQKITLSDNPIAHDNYVPINIRFKPKKGPMLEVNFPFGDAYFIIDTGKNTNIQLGDPSVIPEMQKQHYEFRETQGAFSSSMGGHNTNNRKRTYLVKDFALDSKLPIKSFPISVDNSGAFLIGNGFLKNFTIILDLPNQKAYFQNVKKETINQGYNETFGFTPFWDEVNGLTISAITNKTPASRASLKAGDKILYLNGKDVSKMTKNEFCELLLQYTTKAGINKQNSLEITIQRDKNTPISIVLKK